MDLETNVTFVLYIINGLIFITDAESVYCVVRTDSEYKRDGVWSLITVVESVYNAVRTDSLYKTEGVWSLITVVESVYSAVGTDCLYKADYFWSLNIRGGKSLQRGTNWLLM